MNTHHFHDLQVESEVADSYSFASIFIVFFLRVRPFHMSLSTQYTVAVCVGSLKLGSAVVPGSGAIIIPLSEKT